MTQPTTTQPPKGLDHSVGGGSHPRRRITSVITVNPGPANSTTDYTVTARVDSGIVTGVFIISGGQLIQATSNGNGTYTFTQAQMANVTAPANLVVTAIDSDGPSESITPLNIIGPPVQLTLLDTTTKGTIAINGVLAGLFDGVTAVPPPDGGGAIAISGGAFSYTASKLTSGTNVLVTFTGTKGGVAGATPGATLIVPVAVT